MADVSKIQLPNGTSVNIRDRGAISAPANPSNGDILTWNGTAWVATAPSGGSIYISDTAPVGVPTGTLWLDTSDDVSLSSSVSSVEELAGGE